MGLLIGLIIANVGYFFAIKHLGQTYSNYYDFVALSVVWAGTISVAIITFPKTKKILALKTLLSSIFAVKKTKKEFVNLCIQIVGHNNSTITKLDKTKIENKILKDGVELLDLGFNRDKVQEMLLDRILTHRKRVELVANWLRGLSKYPPAFGLTGTVLGLIHLMRGVSDGVSPKETGIRMAIALVATFYGLIIANLFVNPVGEAVHQDMKHDLELSSIGIESIMLLADNTNLLEAQEQLNSFLEEEDQINIITTQETGINEELAA
ncbi:MAG: hypothetical protein A2504_14295 [Bdellovibrionales bacterium RIFOXYD12_FULL_39_22]|nr:MAG: hypothetical protein A2385_04730 [Bdellovibrionales bacterium RIFOXYB1_FULL_39_21]OFZ43453.1 MAG: hypothetical protein A2485_13245 [Bdellovibrionales bacterium RIFOXYC12_FULL_39_17]OFZ46996.1 MAG: hypothetical protein A2404_00305 [Bdellovibrionales bacterium RIFOXYC1_FULL_39_130]OFZ73227.1 MAG: hypothetical protein A2451_10400 [Bdellovibrionales bacterium RIFOXYC2_FULL_39_8]OFZ76193.1 MAG: hypothetical protein A2560_07555 [Bdellovibrionales bacterium RIFOXYD1_FULL_39_84]OFZ94428.1 MAG: